MPRALPHAAPAAPRSVPPLATSPATVRHRSTRRLLAAAAAGVMVLAAGPAFAGDDAAESAELPEIGFVPLMASAGTDETAAAEASTAEDLFDQPFHLQVNPPLSGEESTATFDPREPSWYTRFGVEVMLPQDLTFDGATITVQDPDPDGGFTPRPVTVDQELTLGWGGGLFAAGGYSFNTDGNFSPRIEGEYQLLIADYRNPGGATSIQTGGITWNSLGVNVLLDYELRDGIGVYGGLGGGMAYISFSNPSIGNDDDFTFYYQALGGVLLRFNQDIDWDLGLRYTTASPEAFEGDVDVTNIAFHVGLLLRLE